MAGRKRPTGDPDTFTRERRTTMPILSGRGAKDPRRSPAGPPEEAVDRMIELLESPDWADLLLVEHLGEEQRAEDAAEWWETADRYVTRTAHMLTKGKRHFLHVPYQAPHLLSRLSRTDKLSLLRDVLEMRAKQVGWTLTVERADVVRMADIPVREAELQVQRPLGDSATQRELSTLAEYPLLVWRQRQDKIRRLQRERAGLREELAAAQRRADEAEGRDPPTPPLEPRPSPGAGGRPSGAGGRPDLTAPTTPGKRKRRR